VDVKLLYHTPDPEKAIATAARLCYASVGAADLMEGMSDESVRKILRTIIGSGHLSTLEHASFTFAIDGVSRAMTHQLVRHRLASYNQQSQRYVTYSEDPCFILPPSIECSDEATEIFRAATEASFRFYGELIKAGVPAEDARYLLPNAMETKIVVTMNVRELLHFFSLRCCKRAQWEIRWVAEKMLELAEPHAPYIFQDAGAGCRRGPCPEGEMSCGEPYGRAPKR
jgi:thymidylate synthase (FAD)